MDFSKVGYRIKIAREAKNLSQEDLAALVDLSPTHISVIERGKKQQDWINLLQLPMFWKYLQTHYSSML